MTYVYPVVSRRARGVSLGINLNPNNACNWRCIYCQVPNLRRGAPPPIDMAKLGAELRGMLTEIVHGDFMMRHVAADMRHLRDIALSGNGEPTSASQFHEVVALIARTMVEFGLSQDDIKLVLITNGSLIERRNVQAGIEQMAVCGGEVWFKFDRATSAGLRLINNTHASPERHYQRLKHVARLCPTWVQTCMFALDGSPPDELEVDAYLAMLTRAKEDGLPLRGVLLYGLARPSYQPEASRLQALPKNWLTKLARHIKALGWQVSLAP